MAVPKGPLTEDSTPTLCGGIAGVFGCFTTMQHTASPSFRGCEGGHKLQRPHPGHERQSQFPEVQREGLSASLRSPCWRRGWLPLELATSLKGPPLGVRGPGFRRSELFGSGPPRTASMAVNFSPWRRTSPVRGERSSGSVRMAMP